ncbi:hypothetical protein FRB90_011007 [Tulasnella sp. 427]|nr:hypothetical protein FRB90_011007 [Tulasnella sp. 427]
MPPVDPSAPCQPSTEPPPQPQAKRGPGRPRKRKATEEPAESTTTSARTRSQAKMKKATNGKSSTSADPPGTTREPELHDKPSAPAPTTPLALAPPAAGPAPITPLAPTPATAPVSSAPPDTPFAQPLSFASLSAPAASTPAPTLSTTLAPTSSLAQPPATSISVPTMSSAQPVPSVLAPNAPVPMEADVSNLPKFSAPSTKTVTVKVSANTRNRKQCAPNLHDENEAMKKAKSELEEKLKQAKSNLRVLKKYKVMWVTEYLKRPGSASNAGAASGATTLIPRPLGEKGKNGWNLQDAMGLNDDDSLYAEILRTCRHTINRAGLDWHSTYLEQEPGRLAACFQELKKQHPYLDRFQGDWPAKEMVISALQNRRKAVSAKSKTRLPTDAQTQQQIPQFDGGLEDVPA